MSGAQKRKKKERQDALSQGQAGAIDKYFTSKPRAEREENQNDHANEEHDQSMIENDNEEVVQPANVNESDDIVIEDPKQPEHEKGDVNMVDDVQHEDFKKIGAQFREFDSGLKISGPGLVSWYVNDRELQLD